MADPWVFSIKVFEEEIREFRPPMANHCLAGRRCVLMIAHSSCIATKQAKFVTSYKKNTSQRTCAFLALLANYARGELQRRLMKNTALCALGVSSSQWDRGVPLSF